MKRGSRHALVLSGLLALSLVAFVPRMFAQESGAVAGVVREAGTGRPLVTAQVTIVETGGTAVTSGRGEFLLTGVRSGPATLRVELLGYASAERDVIVLPGQRTKVDIALTVHPLELDAIVATGVAGPARRREVSHSLARIEPARIAEPVGSIDNLLTARVPGLTVLQSSGMAGSGSQIRLRGYVSPALSSQPMVYLDGVRIRSDGYPLNLPPVGANTRSGNDVISPLNDINPADVERVEVIKGAAAAALYGTEAAAGVIQIFTHRGAPGPPVWAVQVDQGFDRVQEFGTEDVPYLGLEPWLKTAWRQKYAVSVGGGGDVRYYVSGAYDDNEGVLPNDWEKRLVLRGNFDFDPVENLHIQWDTSFTNHDVSNTPAGPNSHGLTFNVYRGSRNFIGDTTKAALDRLLDYEIDTHIDRFIVGASATHTPNDDLSNRVSIGYDRADVELRQLRPFGFILAPEGILSDQHWVNDIVTVDYLGTLEHAWSDALRSSFAWGGQGITSTITSVAGYAESFPGPGEPTLSSGALSLAFEERTRITNAGGFGQTIVGYRDRYFATVGLRIDGNSAFGDDFGLQPYPRLGLSYVISDEPFWRRSWGQARLRASYGHAGRAPGPFDAVRTWLPAEYAGEPAFLPNVVGNPDLGPERTRETEAGFESEMLDGRLSIDFTAYWQKTTDALFPVTQIPSLGFLGTQIANVGTLRNHGIELSISTTPVRRSRLLWDVGLDVATNRNEVVSLGGGAPLLLEQVEWIMEGQPAPVVIGTLVTNPDEIADPIIEPDHVFGPNLPTHTIGIRSSLTFPGDIQVFARGEYQGGFYLFDNLSRGIASRDIWPVCSKAYDLKAEGRAAELTAWQRVWCDGAHLPTDGPIYPADYFRFRELTVRAPLPVRLPGFRSTTLTISGRNFWTWKNKDFLLFDPEMAGQMGMSTRSRYITSQVPPAATLTISVRATY